MSNKWNLLRIRNELLSVKQIASGETRSRLEKIIKDIEREIFMVDGNQKLDSKESVVTAQIQELCMNNLKEQQDSGIGLHVKDWRERIKGTIKY